MTATTATAATAASVLGPLLAPDDMVAVVGDRLLVAGRPAADLARPDRPVVLRAPGRVRSNAEALRSRFAAHWPGEVRGFYAVKADPGPEPVAAALAAGYGLECGGPLELAAAARSGARHVVVNGSGKSAGVLDAAVRHGWHVNVDSPDEARRLARDGRPVDVCVRLKAIPAGTDDLPLRHPPEYPDARSYLAAKRWGLTERTAREVLAGLRSAPAVRVLGLSMHVGRIGDPALRARFVAAFADSVHRLAGALPGGRPEVLDIGGGWPARRDPASGGVEPGPGAEPHVAAACRELAAFGGARLWFEPGAHLVADAAVLLCRVTAVKTDGDRRWVHVDASTTGNLPRHDTAGAGAHVVTATRDLDRPVRPSTVVGAACLGAPFAVAAALPAVVPGEVLAVLDVGAYGPSLQNDFNGYPAAEVVAR